MSAADLSVAMLKKSLEANGLASYGTKEEMFARLLECGTGKKKSGPSPKGDIPKKKKPTSALKATVDAEEATFMATERPRVAAMMPSADNAEQTAYLKRRLAQARSKVARLALRAARPPPRCSRLTCPF